MAAVFLVLVLYHLPQWSENPAGIFRFLLLIGTGLFIDCVASIVKFKRMWCCVSAAVTAAMISLLTNGVPLWRQLIAVVAALVLGKHIWGGTGKNIVNPAMIGLLLVLLFFRVPYPFLSSSLLLLPAILLGLIFLKIRPFAGTSLIVGMLLALYFNQELSTANLLSYGVFFWGCLVITDPVTVTTHPVAGSAAGFLAGFASMFYFPVPISIVIGILFVNLFSAAIASVIDKPSNLQRAKLRIPKAVSLNSNQTQLIDLSGEKDTITEKEYINEKVLKDEKDSIIKKVSISKIKSITKDEAQISHPSVEEILKRIKENEVFGMGGAAFSTYQKLLTVIASKEKEKHLIINGVECDPGLIHDAWLLRNHEEEIQKGMDYLRTCVDFQSVNLAVKDQEGLHYSEPVRLHKVPNSYPIGAERILIAKILKKRIESNQIPAVCGILVLNVQTVYAIYQAVYQNNPVNTRFLTVADLKNKRAQVVKVRLGMKIREVMDAVHPGVMNVFAGGGIMQAYLAEEESIVDNKVNFIATGAFPTYKESPQCSKCGICSKNCPAGLQVNIIADLVDQGKVSKTAQYSVNECIGCGSCSYSCLAGRNLASRVEEAKKATR